MPYYDRIDLSKEIDPAKSHNSKDDLSCYDLMLWFVIIDFLIMDLNFKVLHAMVFMIWQCYVLIQAILVLSLLEIFIIVVLFKTLSNLNQLFS